jgi:hypothetical protein
VLLQDMEGKCLQQGQCSAARAPQHAILPASNWRSLLRQRLACSPLAECSSHGNVLPVCQLQLDALLLAEKGCTAAEVAYAFWLFFLLLLLQVFYWVLFRLVVTPKVRLPG